MNYCNWGFTGSPFQQSSLPASDIGTKLLVGRQQEVQQLMGRLQGTRKAAVLEGLNGIGKTSVVNVAAFSLYKEHIEGNLSQLYLPCRKIFQLQADSRADSFIHEVLLEVAQTLIERKNDLLKSSVRPVTEALDRWLNKPEIKSFQAGIYGFGAGMQTSQSTTDGFERSGFRKLIVDSLSELFTDDSLGGIICCIDNLELLQTSDAARRLVEELRDELLNIQGLRWVLCGALGITYSFATSPRLDGYLHRPIVIEEVNASYAKSIFSSRIDVYNAQTNPYLPITDSDFDRLYKILRGNLRNVLSYTDNYCQHISDGQQPRQDVEKQAAFQKWLDMEADAAYRVATGILTPTTRDVFQKACKEVSFAPSDFAKFGFDSASALRNYIKSLEDVGLVVSVRDENDQRRKSIQVTPKGWLVEYKLQQLSPQASTDTGQPEQPPLSKGNPEI